MSDLEVRRLEITDGFVMPGFRGRYFMWPEEYWLLSKYLDMTRGDYLEIGSMCGIIAMSFAEKYPDRQFVCVDLFSEGHATSAGDRETFLQNLREHNLKNVSLLEGNSLDIVPKLSQRFEIVLVDANHAYDYVLGDGINSWRLILDEGFIAFHDYGYVDDTTRAVDEFLRQTGGRFVESTTSLAIVQKQAAPVRAGLHHYMTSQYDHLLCENGKVLSENGKLLAENAKLHTENLTLSSELSKLHSDIEWLLSSIKTHEEESERLDAEAAKLTAQAAKLIAEKRDLEAVWGQVQSSASWRVLNKWRKLRNWMAPESTWHRKLYDSFLRSFTAKH